MTKRETGKFNRAQRDLYRTPARALIPLLPHLNHSDVYAEPCCGGGDLIRSMQTAGFVFGLQSDILNGVDALTLTAADFGVCTKIITNPPWRRDLMHPMIVHFSDILPTWLLFDADWMHTIQAIPFKSRCKKIVSVGRLKWIPNSEYTGYDNCAWYLFDKNHTGPSAEFFWRE